jgi:tRNA A37 threonylcarbamoyladenosine biosynthesis protein TsaE
MIERQIRHELEQALARQATVALIGPQQAGKTTLANDSASGLAALRRIAKPDHLNERS